MPPRTYPSHDPYAWARCRCGHLQYADEKPGGNCRFCPCENHTAQGGSKP